MCIWRHSRIAPSAESHSIRMCERRDPAAMFRVDDGSVTAAAVIRCDMPSVARVAVKSEAIAPWPRRAQLSSVAGAGQITCAWRPPSTRASAASSRLRPQRSRSSARHLPLTSSGSASTYPSDQSPRHCIHSASCGSNRTRSHLRAQRHPKQARNNACRSHEDPCADPCCAQQRTADVLWSE